MIDESAPAKVNLALHVRRRRPDGYHDLETLFAFAAHGDALRVEPAPADTLAVDGPFADALNGADSADNLVLRAVRAYREALGGPGGYALRLTKNLPVASGIGGGSADAAAALRAAARLNGVAPDDRRLIQAAAGLGADVPACLLGRTALGTGRGDDLVPIPGAPGTPMLLVNPGIAVSTATVFRGWDGIDRGALPDGPLLARASAGRNDLEPPARATAPVIGAVLDLLTAAPGATLVRMSGSGATCFALFAGTADLARPAADARARGWWCLETNLT